MDKLKRQPNDPYLFIMSSEDLTREKAKQDYKSLKGKGKAATVQELAERLEQIEKILGL